MKQTFIRIVSEQWPHSAEDRDAIKVFDGQWLPFSYLANLLGHTTCDAQTKLRKRFKSLLYENVPGSWPHKYLMKISQLPTALARMHVPYARVAAIMDTFARANELMPPPKDKEEEEDRVSAAPEISSEDERAPIDAPPAWAADFTARNEARLAEAVKRIETRLHERAVAMWMASPQFKEAVAAKVEEALHVALTQAVTARAPEVRERALADYKASPEYARAREGVLKQTREEYERVERPLVRKRLADEMRPEVERELRASLTTAAVNVFDLDQAMAMVDDAYEKQAAAAAPKRSRASPELDAGAFKDMRPWP